MLVRLRWSPQWHVESGKACLAQAAGGWTTVMSTRPGQTKVAAALTLGDADTCSAQQLSDANVPTADTSNQY